MSTYLETVDAVIAEVVARAAPIVDRTAGFPQAPLDALRRAGLLGLISAEAVGGGGEGLRAASLVVERLARECGSTAMVLCMHYAGTAVIEKFGPESVRKQIASGQHLSTLAFSESGSRSHFWAPLGTAQARSEHVILNGEKSFVTAAHHASAYVWSSRPVAAEGASTLWLVPRNTRGISSPDAFEGLGLRGNDSAPVTALEAEIPLEARLGEDGGGLAIMLGTVLPIFSVMTAGVAIGLMEGATTAAATHASTTRHEHMGSTLADLATIRAYLARMRIATDQARCLWLDTLSALEQSRADAQLRVLESKAAAGEAATQVLDLAMRVCGGAAFTKALGVERRFRDARAGTVMAPTTDQLYDFIGKAMCGLPVF